MVDNSEHDMDIAAFAIVKLGKPENVVSIDKKRSRGHARTGREHTRRARTGRDHNIQDAVHKTQYSTIMKSPRRNGTKIITALSICVPVYTPLKQQKN